MVYDYQSDKLLREVRLEYNVREFLDAVAEALDGVQKFILYRDINDGGTVYTDIKEVIGEDLECHSLKLLCTFQTPERALEFKRYCLAQSFFKNTYISRSWSLGVEFNPCGGTKGDALDFIKDRLGNIHTSVGIGDYDNDLTLIQHADLGVAVENAVPELKMAADWVVKPCSECAVRDLIERLEADRKEK